MPENTESVGGTVGAQEPIYTQAEWQRIADAIISAAPEDHWIFHGQESLIRAISVAALKFLQAEPPKARALRVTSELKALKKAAKAAEDLLKALEESGNYDPETDNPEWIQRVAEFPDWVEHVVEYTRGRKAKSPNVSRLPPDEPDLRGGRIPPWDEFLRDVCIFWTYRLGLKATRSRDTLAVASGNMVDFVFACGEPLRLRPDWMRGKGPMTLEIALKAIENFKIFCEENMPDGTDSPDGEDSWGTGMFAAIKRDMA